MAQQAAAAAAAQQQFMMEQQLNSRVPSANAHTVDRPTIMSQVVSMCNFVFSVCSLIVLFYLGCWDRCEHNQNVGVLRRMV